MVQWIRRQKGRFRGCLQAVRIDSGCGVGSVPQSAGRGSRAGSIAIPGFLAVEIHPDDVVADLDAVTILQPMRICQAPRVLVDECTVGGSIAQPVSAVLIADLAMLAGDDAAGIGQHPVEILVASDIEAALARNGNADRASVRQAGHILDRKTQRH